MKHLVILSGGLDSTGALALAVAEEGAAAVQALSFDYGQRHARELLAARQIAADLGVRHRVISLDGLLHGSALLGEGDVPEGHYAAATMEQTVVNGRNLLFAAVATAQASPGAELWFGVHAGDHAIYPDCRPEFWEALARLVDDAYGIVLRAPFLRLSKAEALAMGAAAGAPYWLSWSCYKGGEAHCGRCGTCVERAEAFDQAGIADPTEYADAEFWRAVTAGA